MRRLRRRELTLGFVQPGRADLGQRLTQLLPHRSVHAQTSVQSMTTLPHSPPRAVANASAQSVAGKRCVITAETSRPERSMALIAYHVSYISRPYTPWIVIMCETTLPQSSSIGCDGSPSIAIRPP